MHFFSPVPVMPLIELIRGAATTDQTEAAIRALAAEMGKQVIVSADRPGFIVNRILMPFLAESMRAYEEGLGTAEDIDTGARVGLNHPMGPLQLADFIGLDVCLEVMRVLYEGFGRTVPPAEDARGTRRRRPPRPEDRARIPRLPEIGARLRPEHRVEGVRTVSRSNGFARRPIPRRSTNARSSGLSTSPLMNTKRLSSSGRSETIASKTSVPVMPAIRWSHRTASNGNLAHQPHGLLAAGRHLRLVARQSQPSLEEHPDRAFVVEDEDTEGQ